MLNQISKLGITLDRTALRTVNGGETRNCGVGQVMDPRTGQCKDKGGDPGSGNP